MTFDRTEVMLPWSVEMPLPPNMANGRMHWRTKDRLRNEYASLTHLTLMARKIVRPWASPPSRVRIAAHIVVGGLMDVDNLFARLKFALDYLVDDAILPGDSPRELEWAGIPTQEVNRKKPYTVTFTISPITE